jgi:hypothetical protein
MRYLWIAAIEAIHKLKPEFFQPRKCMRSIKTFMIVTVAVLGLIAVPGFTTGPSHLAKPATVSYNPPPANNFHAPLSAMAMLGISGISSANITGLRSAIASSSAARAQSGISQSIRTNALRFINDNSDFPQSETTIAVDLNNPNNIVMGFNDGRDILCPILVPECAGPQVVSLTGFSTSTDGGRTLAKTGDLPDVLVNNTRMVPTGDPSLTPTVDGNFFFATLLFDAFSPFFGNAIMIAKSNANLFDPNVPCTTDTNHIYTNACWDIRIVFGNFQFPVFSVEDKDRIAIDRDPASPFFGAAYISWDHFISTGTSSSYVARCDNDLTGCVMLSGGTQPVISGTDMFASWTTVVTGKNGNVHVAWCNFGTVITFGPVRCKISSSPPGGESFGPPVDILSYMGQGTTLPVATAIIGWATEQFRTATGIISLAADLSPKTNNLYFTTQVCTSGHYYQFPSFIGVALDNPGLCGASTVLFIQSADGGATWSGPTGISQPAVNDQAYLTVDSLTGQVYDVYYTTQFDRFDHRIDVVASTSNNGGQTFHQFRVTSVSNEPDSDPDMFNYLVPSGFGGSFLVPQFGDYFESTSIDGTLYVSFTADYSAEQGTFQTDPFLVVAGPGSQQ